MSKRLRVGFMGATWPCRSHAEGLEGIKGIEHFMVTFALNTPGPVGGKPEEIVRPEWGEIRVYGTKGGIDVQAGVLVSGMEKGVKVVPLRKPKKALPVFSAQAREFVRAVRAGDEPMNSPEQAVMIMQMLDALKLSGEKRRAVRIASVKI